MKMRWTMRRLLTKRILSAHPVVVLLLGCIIALQSLLILSSNRNVNNFEVISDNTRGLKAMNEAGVIMSSEISSSGCHGDDASIDRKKSLVFNTVQRENVTLIMGIPTINRTGDSYLLQTLTSLISNMDNSEKKDVVILVFLADFDFKVKEVIASELWKHFENDIKSGFIQVIQAPKSFYPNENIQRFTYNQEKNYVQWRAKQNVDYAYMLRYSKGLSTYYMQMEDDVIAQPGYITSIYDYIKSQSNWICLEFCELGFIGKLYRNEHIEKLATLMMMFYIDQPVDYTYLFYNNLMVQYQRNIKKPTLFQHMGLHSSYPGKLQHLKDAYFDNSTKLLKGNNPPADVSTSMSTYMTFIPKLAYLTSDGYFWSHGSAKNGDTYTVMFENPQTLSRVVVISGSLSHPDDHIQAGKIEASLTLFKRNEKVDCTNNIEIGTFSEGKVDSTDLLEKIKYKVMCLRITITKDQEPWVIIKEIAVFTS